MRQSHRRALVALTAASGLLLAGCSGGGDEAAQDPTNGQTGTEQSTGAAQDPAQDPSQDIEDGVYAGSGVLLPVPDGFSVNPQALAQGMVAAVSDDGTQQLTAQAVDTTQLQGQNQDLDLPTLVDSVRGQIEQEPAVDEEIELANAENAHRLTYLEMPSQGGAQGGATEGAQPPSSATIVIAESGDGLIGEFSFSAAASDYDEETAELLLAEAGFDPESEPPQMPQPQQQPAPQGDGTAPATEQDGTAPATEGG